MTTNLRVINIQVASSTQIVATFTEDVTPNLITANVVILSNTTNIPSSQVLGITVNTNTVTINCQPLFPFSSYVIQFWSLPNSPFTSINGDAVIVQDGVSNQYYITGPIDPDNPVKDYLLKFFNGNIYDTDDGTIISSYLDAVSVNFARALYDIQQLQNENYLSFQVVDEQQFRGEGPYDRLYEGGAYEVSRVGFTPTNTINTFNIQTDDFPDFPITLQQQSNTETLSIVSDNQNNGTFNIDSLILNLSNSPVTQLNSVVFTLLTANPVYVYNIQTLGYQINNSRYDQDFASSYAVLNNNQVQLNTQILQDPLFDVNNIFKVDVQYQTKDLGRVVDGSSINIFTTLQSIREVLPPIENIFDLQHAPITDINNNIPLLGGISFLDPNSNTGSPHPAFITEIPFRLNATPSMPGQYSIDYTIGRVYVYGADITNDGTGPSPPLATYNYRFNYVNNTDYTFDPTSLDLIAMPLGNLLNNTGNISFNYEHVLVPGIDYTADVHIEALSERVQNRLVALNSVTSLFSPITNVFQVFNETSGEIYTIQRWNNNQIYFQYNNPPNIVQQVGERASFTIVPSELLFVRSIVINSNSLRVFTIFLSNNTIIGASEDGIGYSLNSSLSFTDTGVFSVERWYNHSIDAISNYGKLLNIGEYVVDYINGIIYVAVSQTQQNNIGSATYKNENIVPQFPHVISVNDIYYRISVLEPKNQQFPYRVFSDGSITPEGLTSLDEGFLNNNNTEPYELLQNQVGTFTTSGFIPGVTNQVKYIRGIFEYSDLNFNTNPINFANVSTSNGFNITVGVISKQSFETVQFNGTQFFLTLNENISYLSPNIVFDISVIRASDGYNLWDASGSIVPGDPVILLLPGINNPQLGDLVNIVYSFSIAPISRVIVDYNKGDYFVDYTYLADEIIISYEYGDNVINFQQSNAVSAGTPYYVTYKAGALRDALLSNFGSLINIPQLSSLDIDFPRERYRDALMAALSSFLQGPTVAAIKNIGQIISHIEPQLIEAAFQTWSLGESLLYPQGIDTKGNFQLLPAHLDMGVLIDNNQQSVTLPANFNLRLEEGTFEQWVVPQWNGLDNNSTLTFTITKDGVIVPSYLVFIGASEYHPTIVNSFSLTKLSNVTGIPNTNKDGIFIWYGPNGSNTFDQWHVEVIDGYISGPASTYKIKIQSDGKFYDAQTFGVPNPSNIIMFTGLNTINITVNTGGTPIQQGVTFFSDVDHYFWDTGRTTSKSRLSLFKDVNGYLNFRVLDRTGTNFSISANVSDWQIGEAHQIAASWKLNTRNNRDEMHLFIDGLEVPNTIKYGQKLHPYPHQKFKTINKEEIIGLAGRDIIGSHDLTTAVGSNMVSSSINFSQFNIFIGDTIIINEVGFSTNGYTIIDINGQTLTLSAIMPLTLNADGNFSVNETSYVVNSDIDVAPATSVSILKVLLSGNDLNTNANSNVVNSTSTNFSTQNIQPGYLIVVDSASPILAYTIVQVSANTLVLSDNFPSNQSAVGFQIYNPNSEIELPGVNALHPDYQITKDGNFNNVLTIYNGVFSNDLILVRTFGLNHRSIKKQYYVWSNQVENVIMTQLPAPISLDEVNITKIITPVTAIGPNNSTLSGGIFVSNNLSTAQPTNAQDGRTITAVISGNNTDFSTPVQVTLHGVIGIINVSETITFTDYGSLDFPVPFISLYYVTVSAKPINPSKPALTIELREKYPMTHSEFSGAVPVIRFSYHITGGYNLQSADGYTVTDETNVFSDADIGNYLIIHSPPSVAGFYTITSISSDRHSLSIQPTYASFPVPLPSFTNGIYQVLNATQYRSGLQNGFFTFEVGALPGQAYFLKSGFYEFEYSTYVSIKLDPLNQIMHFGNDINNLLPADAILGQTVIYSTMLSDTRIGETISNNQLSITKDFNSLILLRPNNQMLVLSYFNSFPFTNLAPTYVNTNTDRVHFQSNWAVNDNFQQSIVILNKPIILSNAGILDTRKQGTIEFWMSSLFDTANDPNIRYYFDAYGALVQQTISSSDTMIPLSSPASKILSVKLVNGNDNIDYFAGGKIEITTRNAIQENGISIGNAIVMTSQPIFQVISVKIIGDPTETDYFTNGSIGTDKQTIYLGKVLPENSLPLLITYQPISSVDKINSQVIVLNKRLPNQNTPVVVNYIPQGLQGDRISIFKDKAGYVNFNIVASNIEYVIRGPTYWAKNTWHRVKASYKINGAFGQDEMRLFLDGYQYSNILFGQGLTFGPFPMAMGSVTIGDGYGLSGNIRFKDPINNLFIGSQYNEQYPAFTLLDNLRISNISRPIYAPFGEPIDVNYTSNLNAAIPVTPDLYTTYLLDYNKLFTNNPSFAILTDRETGSFDFTVNIFDSFDIVSSNATVKQTLETLINTLKPANTVAYIKYTT